MHVWICDSKGTEGDYLRVLNLHIRLGERHNASQFMKLYCLQVDDSSVHALLESSEEIYNDFLLNKINLSFDTLVFSFFSNQ